jgi:hypothetical protein
LFVLLKTERTTSSRPIGASFDKSLFSSTTLTVGLLNHVPNLYKLKLPFCILYSNFPPSPQLKFYPFFMPLTTFASNLPPIKLAPSSNFQNN